MDSAARHGGGRSPCWGREFTLAEVERLDVDAVHVGDGYDYRYHRGGRITWFSLRSGEELEVTQLTGLPQEAWHHFEGCACRDCSGVAAPSDPARGESAAPHSGRAPAAPTPHTESIDTSSDLSVRPGQPVPHGVLRKGEEKE